MNAIVDALARFGGAARFGELAIPRATLARAVARGVVLQPARGCYALVGAPRELLVAVRLDGAVSCVSALRLAGLTAAGDASLVHCSVGSHRGAVVRLPSVRRHFEDVPRDGARRVVRLPWAVARAATCLAYDDAVAVLDAVARQSSRALLSDALEIVATRRSDLARDLRLDVDGAARSAIETRIRLGLRRAGLSVAAGVFVPGVGEVDLLVEGVLIVELDGFAYHSGRAEYVRDRRRDRSALRLGVLTIRFAYEDCDLEIVLAAVRRALASIGPRGLSPAPDVTDDERSRWEGVRALATGPASRVVGRTVATAARDRVRPAR